MRTEVWELVWEVASEEAAKEGITLPPPESGHEEAVRSLGAYGFDSLSLVEVVMIAEERGLSREEADEVIGALVR